MCGIVGLIGKNNTFIREEDIHRMSSKIKHRGPDAYGIYVEGTVGVGHRRLSILDTSDAGTQPMWDHDKRYVIVYNGEIYNYLELRKELALFGVEFFSDTDTEVILEAYKKWGSNCVKRFNGMWSFAIYDTLCGTVLFSRDRFGVKPLYIYENDEYFAFASEIKCITAVFPEERRPNLIQINRYLSGVQEDRDDLTFYENIFSFPKAHNGLFNISDGKIEYKVYWKLSEKLLYGSAFKENPYKKFRMLLEDSIRIRLRSDVPVGASLSGGLDSSAIVGIAAKACHTRLNTFSSIYEDEKCNERNYIDAANDFSELERNYIYPDKKDDLIGEIAQMTYYHDGPCVSASPYSGFCVYQKAKEKVKVMLDGQGADELLGGYLFNYKAYLNDLMLKGKQRQVKKIVKRMADVWPEEYKKLDTNLKLRTIGIKKYVHRLGKAGNEQQAEQGLLSQKMKLKNAETKECDYPVGRSELARELHRSFNYDILPRILHDVDRNSMASSIEVRLPFLDYRLVEFCYGLDDSYKIRGMWTKYIMRRSLKRYLPREICMRKTKMGFPAPFYLWIRDSRYTSKIKGYIDRLKERNVINPGTADAYFDQHIRGVRDWSNSLFKMLSLEIWFENEIDQDDEKWVLE